MKHPLESTHHQGSSVANLIRAKASATGLARQQIDLELAMRDRAEVVRGIVEVRKPPEVTNAEP